MSIPLVMTGPGGAYQSSYEADGLQIVKRAVTTREYPEQGDTDSGYSTAGYVRYRKRKKSRQQQEHAKQPARMAHQDQVDFSAQSLEIADTGVLQFPLNVPPFLRPFIQVDNKYPVEIYVEQIFHNLGGQEQFDDVDVQLIRMDHENPDCNEVAHAALRITVTTSDISTLPR